MCTAITYKTKDFYFGRTLDLDFCYHEEVTITPRKYNLKFKYTQNMPVHYAMIGMAYVPGDYPLYYDAVNEKGLCIAGLNFVGNACYANEPQEGKINLAQFEFIPYILGRCATTDEAEECVKNIHLLKHCYDEKLGVAELHWIIADKQRAITVEYMEAGLKIYENKVGVLTNNPPFDVQIFNLNNYMSISPKTPKNLFSSKLDLKTYNRGMGALGLPGDLSSLSRFVRAAFTKINSAVADTEDKSVNQFFHILGSVEQQKGCCIVGDDEYEITVYTACCNADKGIYYYTTYENHSITSVNMYNVDVEGSNLFRYPLIRWEKISFQN